MNNRILKDPIYVYSDELARFVAFNRERRQGVQPIGIMEVPEHPVHFNGWLYEPLADSTIKVPRKAVERVIELSRNFNVKWVVAHEAPPLLAAPKKEVDWQQVERHLKQVKEVANDAGKLLLAGAKVAAAAAGVVALGTVYLLGGLVMLDPAIIAILPDGTAVEIYRWYE